jgi:hypothetical protein
MFLRRFNIERMETTDALPIRPIPTVSRRDPMKARITAPLLLLPVLAILSTPALAQGTAQVGFRGWGVRVGGSSNPDQIYAGFHWDLGEFARNVRFRPNVEIGFGDSVKVLQGNAEVHYVFSKVQVWKPYVGGSAGFIYADPDDGNSETNLSLMGVGGVETKLKSATAFFMEAKIGLTHDDPDLKIGVGWTWK